MELTHTYINACIYASIYLSLWQKNIEYYHWMNSMKRSRNQSIVCVLRKKRKSICTQRDETPSGNNQ